MAAFADVQHYIGHTLPRSVVGVLPASLCGVDFKSVRIGQVFDLCGCASGIERRVFNKPNTFLFRACINRVRTRLHKGDGVGVARQAF